MAPHSPQSESLTALSAVQAADLIRDGRLKSEALVQECIDRIQATDGELGAWAWMDADCALRQAKEMDHIRWHGKPVGALHGVPVGIKDIIDTKGIPTERGSAVCAGRIPRKDAFVIDRLRDAGAVIMGKSVTTEMAFMRPSDTVNPHNMAHSPGGSSSGAAASVAAFQVPLGIGTQTNGSVIRPASFCGVFGFKPSRGLISRTGILRTCQSLDQVGVFARCLEDVAALADAIVGSDSTDPSARLRPQPQMLAGARSEVPIEPSLVWIDAPYHNELPDDARQGLEDVKALLAPRVENIPAPGHFHHLLKTHKIIQDYEIGRNLRRLADDHFQMLSPQLLNVIKSGQQVDRKTYRSALQEKAAAERYFHQFFWDYDAIIAPASLGEAPALVEKITGDPVCSTVWTLCGLPCLSLPILTGHRGLPIGVQLIGGPEEDDRLLRTAHWVLKALAPSSLST